MGLFFEITVMALLVYIIATLHTMEHNIGAVRKAVSKSGEPVSKHQHRLECIASEKTMATVTGRGGETKERVPLLVTYERCGECGERTVLVNGTLFSKSGYSAKSEERNAGVYQWERIGVLPEGAELSGRIAEDYIKEFIGSRITGETAPPSDQSSAS